MGHTCSKLSCSSHSSHSFSTHKHIDIQGDNEFIKPKKDINSVPSSPSSPITDLRASIQKLQQQCKIENEIGNKMATEYSIRFLREGERIPPCPPEIAKILILDPNAASLNQMVGAFETILKTSREDVLNLKTTASLVCAQLSFVIYFNPYTKVKRDDIDHTSHDDLREVYNMMVAISKSADNHGNHDDKDDQDKNFEFISMMLKEIVSMMKEKLPLSMPQLY